MLQVVSDLDRINTDLVLDSENLLGAIKEARLGYKDAEVRKQADEVIELQRGYRGTCVTAPPIGLN